MNDTLTVLREMLASYVSLIDDMDYAIGVTDESEHQAIRTYKMAYEAKRNALSAAIKAVEWRERHMARLDKMLNDNESTPSTDKE